MFNMQRQKNKFFVGLILLILLIPHTVFCSSFNDAKSAMANGEYAEAVGYWTQYLSAATDPDRVELFIRRGEAYRALGFYNEAQTDFESAIDIARNMNSPVMETAAMQSLGYVYFLKRDLAMAESLLRNSFAKSETLNQPVLSAACANRLGIVLYNEAKISESYTFYKKALDHIKRADDPGLEATIRLNIARVLSDQNLAMAEILEAKNKVDLVESPYERAELLMNIAASVQQMGMEKQKTKFCYDTLQEANIIAKNLGTFRLRSLSAGMMGAIYERNGRISEALSLTDKAIDAAQYIESHELLLKWKWQKGRLLNVQGKRIKAIEAYRQAVDHIQAIRQDIPISYHDGRSSFRETLSPIYLGLADLLLQQAKDENEDTIQKYLFREAQKTVELIKQSELRDYFKDPCISARSHQIESLLPATAVIYPIILPDRLELLADIDGKLHLAEGHVTAEKFESTVIKLAQCLRNGSAFKKLSQDVHKWVIDPLMPILDKNHVNTLVFVPDGVLRLIPISALWDGERFLVERYAVAIVPCMTLLDANPLSRKDIKPLLAGMSVPGPVVFELPSNLWDLLSETAMSNVDRGVRGLQIAVEKLKTSDKMDPLRKDQKEVGEKIKKILSLPGVAKEISQLAQEMQGQILLNEEFQMDHFSTELKEQSYRVIHIASHGFFGGAPEQNFIMAYDKILDMNQLEALIKSKQFATEPVE